MGMQDRIKTIIVKDEFINDYMSPSYGITSVGGIKNISEYLKIRNLEEKFSLQENETLDDYCVTVYLKDKTSIEALPKHYKGLRFFYEVTGEVFPL